MTAEAPRGTRTTPVLEAIALTKRYSTLAVVEDVTLRLPPGSKTALLGANGAGKSTLLGMLSTLIVPSAGEVRVGGVTLGPGTASLRRRLGVLAHSPMLYEELTPLENLQFFAELYDVADATARIETLLRTVGLWRRRREPTHVFSRGQHQRLALARALVHDPDVLLLDEPETGLDVDGVALLDELMLTVPGFTVLAATHRVDHVEVWADGVVRLERGRVVEQSVAGDAPGEDATAGADDERRAPAPSRGAAG